MIRAVIPILAAALVGICSLAVFAAQGNQRVTMTDTVSRYALQEFTIDTDLKTANPFDPRLGGVYVQLTSPSGKGVRVPGFYSGTGSEPGPWKIRFTPDEVGSWRYKAFAAEVANTQTQKEAQKVALVGEGSFDVKDSSHPGFVRISKKDPLYFEYDNGNIYFPIGENLCWYGSGKIGDYDRWISGLKANGVNYIRLWMASWGFSLEWNDTGLGNYTQRLDRAEQLDYVFKAAERYGIKILLCINNHGMFSANTNPEWKSNPYNVANGGMLKKPQDFFTNEQAKAMFKQKLDYIVARWGYSPSLMAWELFNEVDLTDGYSSKAMAAWHKEMADYIRSIDPYRHLVTTSFADPAKDSAVWSLPEIDFTQTHFYSMADTAALVNQYTSEKATAFKKPTIIGEFGLDTGGASNTELDPVGDHLHIGLWSAMASGSAGGAMLWWWDNYIDPLDLYHHFGAAVRFSRGVDYGAMGLHPAKLSLSGGSNGFLAVTPNLGWGGKPADPNYKVDSQGVTAQSVVSFLYGATYNTGLRTPPAFNIDLASATTMSIGVGTVAKAGARLVVKIDGTSVLDVKYPSGSKDTAINAEYKITIASGQHKVEIDNRGTDWLTITGYRFESAAFPGIKGYALAGNGTAIGWFSDTKYTVRDLNAGYIPRQIDDAKVVFTGLKQGMYAVEFWDPWTGSILKNTPAAASIDVGAEGKAELLLPAFTKDIAVKLAVK